MRVVTAGACDIAEQPRARGRAGRLAYAYHPPIEADDVRADLRVRNATPVQAQGTKTTGEGLCQR